MEQQNAPYLSVVSPVYGCSTSLVELYIRLTDTLKQITSNYEIILVNDASPDDAWDVIVKLCEKDPLVKGINLSRNFGQHYAITAGLDHAQGEWVIVMDCDLQDRPEEILNLYKKATEGFDIVYGKRENRTDPFLKKISSRIFYLIFSYFTDSKVTNSVANYCISNKKVITQIINMREHYRSYLLFLRWTGFNSTEIKIEHGKRMTGKSSYSLKKSLTLAFNTVVSFSDKPLRLTIKFGIIITIISFSYVLILVLRNLIYGTGVLGWSSLIASIFFSLGVIITILGIIGIYIGKIFEEVKNRPLYIIKTKIFNN